MTLSGGKLVNYLKVGEGNHVLLLCPGAVGTIWSDFKPQVESLDRTRFTVIAWDPPGYGNSRPPNRKFTPNFYEEDAEATREFLNVSNYIRYKNDVDVLLLKILGYKKFSLVGWSDGGISSMITAVKYPDEVQKLIVWGSNAYVLPEEIEIYESEYTNNDFEDF